MEGKTSFRDSGGDALARVDAERGGDESDGMSGDDDESDED